MHYGLTQACSGATVACAFDINEVANDVYQHNHGQRPHQVQQQTAGLHLSCDSNLTQVAVFLLLLQILLNSADYRADLKASIW